MILKHKCRKIVLFKALSIALKLDIKIVLFGRKRLFVSTIGIQMLISALVNLKSAAAAAV